MLLLIRNLRKLLLDVSASVSEGPSLWSFDFLIVSFYESYSC